MIQYREAGIDVALRQAASIIGERGLSRGISYDAHTDRVDVTGAIVVSLGGKCSSPMYADIFIPPAKVAAFEATMEILEAEVGDIYDWSDTAEEAAVVSELIRLSDKISIALV